MKRFFPALIILIVTGSSVWAQNDANFSQYFMSQGYYNAGYAGVTGDLNITGMHKQQWVNMSGRPQPFLITADRPFMLGKISTGLGVMFYSERIGLFQNMSVGLQLAYKRKLFGGTLSIGLQPGISNSKFDGEKVVLPDDSEKEEGENGGETDPAIPSSNVSGMAFDLNAGIYYAHKRFYAGVGIMHALEPEMSYGDNFRSYIPRTINFTAGYNIQLKNPLYELQPSVFMLTDMQSLIMDITARLVYNKMFNGGFSWRADNSRMGNTFVVLLGATFGKFDVGYAYDLPANKLIGSGGSHELMVKFRLKLNKTKSGNYRHKSVRIL